MFSVLTERVIGVDELPFEILQQWGSHRSEVRFYLRHQEGVPVNGENGLCLPVFTTSFCGKKKLDICFAHVTIL